MPGHPSPDEAADYVGTYLPMDPNTSTLTPASSTAEVGKSETMSATVLDQYDDPINNDSASIFDTALESSTPLTADVSPDNLPSGYEYPVTDQTGTVSFDVSDTCAQQVTLGAADLGSASWDVGAGPTTPVTPPTSYTGTTFSSTASVTFTAGAAVAPDAATTPSTCGVAPTASSVTVTTNNEGLPFTSQPIVGEDGQNGANALTAVSCASTTFCMGVDNAGNAMAYSGRSVGWGEAVSIDTGSVGGDAQSSTDYPGWNKLVAISCPSTSFCMAIDKVGNAFTYDGAAWSSAGSPYSAGIQPQLANGIYELTSLSCASASFCVAVSLLGIGQAVIWNGTGWGTGTSLNFATPTSVSCPTSRFCTAVDTAGDVYDYNGVSWSLVSTHPFQGDTLSSVSCTSASFCAVLDNTGDAATYTAGSWSALTPTGAALPAGTDWTHGNLLSCTTSNFCFDASGAYYDGTSWQVDNDYWVHTSASCVTSTFCMDLQDPAGPGFASGTVAPAISEVPIAPAGSPVSAGDLSHDATVTVVLADQYGNPDACHQVVLSPASAATSPTITPEAPPVGDRCSAPGTNGPGYTGLDGTARFEVTDASSESVVLGVTDTTVVSVWPSNATSDPNDVAQAAFEAPSYFLPLGVPAGASADNAQGATVTATLQDERGQAVSGVTVGLQTTAESAGTHAVIEPATEVPGLPAGDAESDANGVATFQVTDAVQETATFQATSESGGPNVQSATGDLAFTNGGISVTSDHAGVVADGIGQHLVTVRVADSNDQAIPYICVLLQVTGQATIAAPGNSDQCSGSDPGYPTEGGSQYLWEDAPNGIATFSVTDTTAQPVTITATAPDDRAVTNEGPGVLQPSPGNPCVAPFEARTYGAPVNATYCVLIGSTAVNFVNAPASFSIVTPSPAQVPGDGLTQLPVAVTATDVSGNPVPGLPVYLCPSTDGSLATSETAQGCASTTSDESIAVADTSSPGPAPDEAITDQDGVANFVVSGTVPDGSPVSHDLTVGYSSDENDDSVAGSDLALACPSSGCGAATFTVLPTEATSSSVAVTSLPSPLPADGTTAVQVTVTLRSGGVSGTPLGGHVVVLETSSTYASVTPPSTGPATNSSGVVVFKVTDSNPSSQADAVTYTAFDATTAVAVSHTRPTTTFEPPEAIGSSIGVAATTSGSPVPSISLPLGSPTARSQATVTVTLQDASGNKVADHPVALVADTVAGGPSTTATVQPQTCQSISGAECFTNSAGVATFTVEDSVPESLVLQATDEGAAPAVTLDSTAGLTFAPDVFSQSIVRASPVTVLAGEGSSTLSVDLRGADFQPEVGWAAKVTDPGGATVAAIGSSTSDLNGQVRFTLTDQQPAVFCPTPGSTSCLEVMVTPPGGTGQYLDQTGAVDFVPSERTRSSVTASPASLPATHTSTVTVTLLDGQGNKLKGHKVALSGCGTTLVCTTATPAVTSSAGTIKFSVTSSTARVASIIATDQTTGVQLAPVKVTFTKASASPEATRSRVSVTPSTQHVGKSSTVTVLLRDGSGRPLAGHQVALSGCGQALRCTVLTTGGRTTSAGSIRFAVTSRSPVTWSLAAIDTGTGVMLARRLELTFVKA